MSAIIGTERHLERRAGLREQTAWDAVQIRGGGRVGSAKADFGRFMTKGGMRQGQGGQGEGKNSVVIEGNAAERMEALHEGADLPLGHGRRTEN